MTDFPSHAKNISVSYDYMAEESSSEECAIKIVTDGGNTVFECLSKSPVLEGGFKSLEFSKTSASAKVPFCLQINSGMFYFSHRTNNTHH